MDKYAVWVKASERLPGKDGRYVYKNTYSGHANINIAYFNVQLKNFVFNGHELKFMDRIEWLDESQSVEVDRGVEKAEDYAAIRYPFVALEEKSLVADNAIIEACRNAYIAGAKDADYWKQRCEAGELLTTLYGEWQDLYDPESEEMSKEALEAFQKWEAQLKLFESLKQKQL